MNQPPHVQLTSLCALMSLVLVLCTVDANAQATTNPPPLIVEAESGILGNAFSILESDGVTYVAPQTAGAETAPGDTNHVVSFEVTFPTPGRYTLFARIRASGGNDSFFYAENFGEQTTDDADDWVLVDRVGRAGFTNPTDIVDGTGVARTGVWKWINLSANDYGETPERYTIFNRRLTQTFQLGAREAGFEIDKLAFAPEDLFYTVRNLDNVEPGSVTLHGDAPFAQGLPKFLGNVYSSSQIQDFTLYWNQVTPENAGKWGSVESTRDVMTWDALDAAYQLAKDNGFPFRFHVLVWGNQQPSWIETLPTDEQLAEIEEWFMLVAERYPDIDYLEVVNEPLHDPPNTSGNGGGNYIDALGGDGTSGWDWILTAFRMARQHFPTAKLMINDFNILSSTANATRYREIIELLQAENLIDAIGMQGHAFSTGGSAASMIAILDQLATTGLPIQITELDIDGPTAQQQQTDYQRIFPALWEHPSVTGITLWGWKPGMWRTDQGAFLIDTNGEPRPALFWLGDYFASRRVTTEQPEHWPTTATFSSIYPNPLTQSGTIVYTLEKATAVTVEVYDLMGRLVQTLQSGYQLPGEHTVSFSSADWSSGMYICRIRTGASLTTRSMVVIR